MSILIVDDNAMNAKILEYILKKNGYQTIVVPSGVEALECLEAVPEIQLVISDIMMPEMDGLELLDRIKQRHEWRNIPVIMCTSFSDVETVRKAAEAGCRNYIVKPIKAVQLVQTVREALIHEEAILKDKSIILHELGIDHDVYDDLRRVFTDLVGDTIAVLEKLKKEEPLADNSVNLINLLESASLMGAEKVTKILDTMLDPRRDSSDHLLLLRELKVLFKSLTWKKEKAPAAPDEQPTDLPAPDK